VAVYAVAAATASSMAKRFRDIICLYCYARSAISIACLSLSSFDETFQWRAAWQRPKQLLRADGLLTQRRSTNRVRVCVRDSGVCFTILELRLFADFADR
jgi:hypothetical protein